MTPRPPEIVYDITVDEHHEFFANGILVHNSVCVGMGLLHVLPGALPPGSHGPTGVNAAPKPLPIGVTPSARPGTLNDAVGRHGAYGLSGGGSAWDRGDIS